MSRTRYNKVIIRNRDGKVMKQFTSLPPLSRLTVRRNRRGKTTIERQGIFMTTRYLATHNESVETRKFNFRGLLLVFFPVGLALIACAALFRFKPF